jgi:hypothetical protein
MYMDITTMSRRKLAGLSGAGLAAVLTGRTVIAAQAATPDPATTPVTGDTPLAGIAGGGTLTAPGGEVSFSLAVFRSVGATGEPVVQGSFLLSDQTAPTDPVAIEGIEFTEFEQLSMLSPAGRRIVGWATLNGSGEYPFLLQVEDLGAPGSGEDTFHLVLGEDAVPFLADDAISSCDCAGFSYNVQSGVLSGDLALFNLR